jgi:hypothetical protein
LAGISDTTVLPAAASVRVNGTTYTQSALVTLVQGVVAPYITVQTLRGQLAKAVEVMDAAEVSSEATIAAVIASLIQYFGSASPVLPKLGIASKKPRQPMTAEQKAQAVARARATRLLRGTKGKRQKEAIKSNITTSVTVQSGGTPAAGTTASPQAGSATTSAS